MRTPFALLLVLACCGCAAGAQATLPVFGVVEAGDLPPRAASWFAANQPEVFRRLVVGVVTVAVADAALAAATAAPVHHADLAVEVEADGAGWRIVRTRALRLDRLEDGRTVVLGEYAAPTAPVLQPAALDLRAYRIQRDPAPALVRWIGLGDGFAFPTSADAAGFRWKSPTRRLPALADSRGLSAGGVRLAAADAGTLQPLDEIDGAWVQLRDSATGVFRYLRQSAMTHLDPAAYDPVWFDGRLILGGTCAAGDGTATRGSYPLGTATCAVTFDARDAAPLSGVPTALPAAQVPDDRAAAAVVPRADWDAAAASEQRGIDPGADAIVDTSVQRGPVPELASDGTPTGRTVEFYPDGGDQGTDRVVDDVLTMGERTSVGSADPDDLTVRTTDGSRSIALEPRAEGPGASGKSMSEALGDAAAADCTPSLGGGDAAVTLDDTDDAGRPVQRRVSAGDLLVAHDQALDREVDPVATADGEREAQEKPLVIAADGSVADARAGGASEDLHGRLDDINAEMAKHMEATTWTRSRRDHHGAMIYPIDWLDDALCAQWRPITGVAVPDLAGASIPGDGDNPEIPEPVGTPERFSAVTYASRPFYDFDDDGDLDRFYTTDPFDDGYKKLHVRWCVEVGVKKFGSFRYHPPINVLVTGMKKPRRDDAGAWTIDEDLLLHIGHNLRPFKRRKWFFGWQNYYCSGLITPLDPTDAGDPTRYQFAIRNVAADATGEGDGSDGADPEDLIPEVDAPIATLRTAPDADGVSAVHTVQYRIEWFPRLDGQLLPDDPPDPAGDWVWRWDPEDFALPAGIDDRPGVPVVVTATECTAAGDVVATRVARRPVLVAPDGARGFDPTLVPLAQHDATPPRPLRDAYMWDYPRGRSTAELRAAGVPDDAMPRPDVRRWAYPWNIAFNGQEQSRRHSAQSFALNSADLSLWPEWRNRQPKLTHAGLQLDRGDDPIVVQWSLRENPADQPAAATSAAIRAWRDGEALFLRDGWQRGMAWFSPGRSPFHVTAWDGRTDMFDASRAVGGARIERGDRIYDITGGAIEYTFRGKRYLPRDLEEQYLLLHRMWNYYLSGREYPRPGQSCLPSLCIPQRFDNWDLAATPLNQARVPDDPDARTGDTDGIAGDEGDERKLAGSLVGELRAGDDQRRRKATERRARLMREQVYLFSAARGREWELAMARRMPASTRLVCVEYDDRDDVQRILGRDGHSVAFPESRRYSATDAFGVTTETTVSTEVDVLRQLSLEWFDTRATELYYGNGAVSTSDQGLGQPGSLQSTTKPKFPSMSGSGSTIAANPTGGFDGFMRRLPEGIPMAFAAYAYALRSRPESPERQWRVDDGQTLYRDHAFEFRHPMLVLYHDAASCIYVHYGRNCDPDEVFGHWDDCRPPATRGPVVGPEALRRERFEAWEDDARLGRIFDALHPEGRDAEFAAAADAPTEPALPGDEPREPAAPPFPGAEPQAPVGRMPAWDGVGEVTWTLADPLPDPDAWLPLDWCPWYSDPDVASIGIRAGYERWMATLTPYDPAVTGWLRVRYPNRDCAGTPVIDVWRADGPEPLQPLGDPALDASALCFGEVIAPVAGLALRADDRIAVSDAADTVVLDLAGATSQPFAIAAGATRLRLANDAGGDGRFAFDDAGAAGRSFAAIAHPMTPAWYDALALSPTVARYDDLQQRRRAAVAAYRAAVEAYPPALAAWRAAAADETRYQQDLATYPMRHAAWQATVQEHARWVDAAAAWSAARDAGARHAADRDDWRALVRDAVAPAGVAWPGDAAALREALADLAAITPQLPIWEAYRWFVDPANAVPEATAVEPR